MNRFAILHSKDSSKKEIIYFPIIYFPIIDQDDVPPNIYTYMHFHLNDREEKIIDIVKHQLRIDESEVESLRSDLQKFQNNSNKTNFFTKETFSINNIIFDIAVNQNGKGLLLVQPDTFNRRVKRKNKFRRRWVMRDLDLISNDSLNSLEIDIPAIYSIKREIFNQVYVDKWNNIMLSLLKKP